MIKINKSKEIPKILKGKGFNKTKDLIEKFNRNNNYFDDKKSSKVFDNTIYGHKEVKEQLIKDQHGKCCFCESKILHITSGDVEHFHPKMEVKYEEKGVVSRPGYFWLAYDWNNLMLACEVCNRVFKKIDFPLINIKRKVGVGKIEKVFNTLLINPCVEQPENHIVFKEENVVAKTKKGEYSIKYFGLDRPYLRERRGEKLQNHLLFSKNHLATNITSIGKIELLADLFSKNFENLRNDEQRNVLGLLYGKISECNPIVSDNMEYAGMLRANFTPTIAKN